MLNMEGKVVVITGAGNGLGKEAALLFAKEGATVIVLDYNAEAAKSTHDLIDSQGLNAAFCDVDVSNKQEVDTVIESIIVEYDRIDVLINNAGITQDRTLLKMSEEQYDNVVAVNQKGVFNCTQAVAKYMVEQGSGKIINTSSIVGKFGNFGQTNYAATKAAVIAMTQTWAKELGPKGINVNAVAPGFIETDMTKKMPENVLDNMRKSVSLRRLGSPMDVANVYLFLASEQSDYINGAVISVDGGLSI